MTVRIVTDSASDIPSELAQELGVVVVPCTVSFGTEVFRDGVDITKDEFFERLTTSKVMPTTAQPSVNDFIEAYKPLVDQGDEIVSVHVSGKLSGTLNSARLAMQEFPNAKIETVDSLQASMGVVLAVKAAAEAAQAGADMEAVVAVTDSASDIPSELAQELGVVVVPCTVSFGTEVFRDGVDITKDEFFERLTTSKVMPTTAQPSVSDFIEAYKPLVDQGDEIVSVHVSGKLSGTLNSARLAMQEFPNAKIETVDSLQASMGVVLAVKAAAEAAQAGADMEAVVAVAQDAVSKIDTYFALDTLEYLQKGGRIGKAQALMGSLLSVKPVLTIADGEVHPFEKVRTRAKAIQRIKDLATEGAPYADLALIHRSSEADVADMAAHLAQFTSKPLTIGSVGASIGAHTGPGMIALALRKA